MSLHNLIFRRSKSKGHPEDHVLPRRGRGRGRKTSVVRPWLGGFAITTAVIVLAPSALETARGLRQRRRSALTVVDTSAVEQAGYGSYVFPQTLHLTGREMDELNAVLSGSAGPEGYSHWAEKRGGVMPEILRVDVTLQGARTEPVRILNIQPIARCSDPPRGTLLQTWNYGGDNASVIGFNLDDPQPIAREVLDVPSPEIDEDNQAYFSTHVVQLAARERRTFRIVATTQTSHCELVLEATVMDGGKRRTQRIDDHGQPFKVSALLRRLGTPEDYFPATFADYAALYVLHAPVRGGSKFLRADPLEYGRRAQ